MLPLADQRALVTGSSGGIGKAIALALADAGADVIVHARGSRDAAEQTAAQIKQKGREARVLLADLSDEAVLANFGNAAWNCWGHLDICVNNAGVDVLTGEGASWPFSVKLQKLWQVDVAATMALSRLLGDRMRRRGQGAILNVGWDQAEHGMGGDSGELFAAVKGAVMAFTRSLAVSLAPQVRVNCVAPGWIQTAWGQQASMAWHERAKAESLLRRWGRPEDIASVAAFLVSPAADFVTGQIVPVNGGLARRAEPEPLPRGTQRH